MHISIKALHNLMRAENVLLGPIYDTLGLNNTESDTYQLTQADIDAIGIALDKARDEEPVAGTENLFGEPITPETYHATMQRYHAAATQLSAIAHTAGLYKPAIWTD